MSSRLIKPAAAAAVVPAAGTIPCGLSEPSALVKSKFTLRPIRSVQAELINPAKSKAESCANSLETWIMREVYM